MMFLFVSLSRRQATPNQRLKLSHGCLFASLTGSWRSLTKSLGSQLRPSIYSMAARCVLGSACIPNAETERQNRIS